MNTGSDTETIEFWINALVQDVKSLQRSTQRAQLAEDDQSRADWEESARIWQQQIESDIKFIKSFLPTSYVDTRTHNSVIF